MESGRHSVFGDCIGMMDGTLVNLEYCPAMEDAFDYFTCKGHYAFNVLAICDFTKQVRYLNIGWTGSVHDQRVLNNSDFGRHPDRYLAPEEYVLADAGYTPNDHVLTPYKTPRGGRMGPRQKKWNKKLSSSRMPIENTFGIAKARFQSLKGLTTQMRTEQHVRRAVHWIKACFILHNFLMNEEGEDFWADDDEEAQAALRDERIEHAERLAAVQAGLGGDRPAPDGRRAALRAYAESRNYTPVHTA